MVVFSAVTMPLALTAHQRQLILSFKCVFMLRSLCLSNLSIHNLNDGVHAGIAIF